MGLYLVEKVVLLVLVSFHTQAVPEVSKYLATMVQMETEHLVVEVEMLQMVEEVGQGFLMWAEMEMMDLTQEVAVVEHL
jgi:hypothetical protein